MFVFAGTSNSAKTFLCRGLFSLNWAESAHVIETKLTKLFFFFTDAKLTYKRFKNAIKREMRDVHLELIALGEELSDKVIC